MNTEKNYKNLVRLLLAQGEIKVGRNGKTISVTGTQLKFDSKYIPLLNGRKIFFKGVVGEFAAFMNNAKTVEEFKKYGCNYWDSWADSDGKLNLDYVNQLHKKVDGYNTQIDLLKYGLKNDKYSRRHIINLWVPENVENESLSLPCCHVMYQFLANEDNTLDMIWTQRSADLMVGVPSDMLLAYLWVQGLAKELGFTPGIVTMNFGDTHIYNEHIPGAKEYLEVIRPSTIPKAHLSDEFTCIEEFKPNQLIIDNYEPNKAIKFELKV